MREKWRQDRETSNNFIETCFCKNVLFLLIFFLICIWSVSLPLRLSTIVLWASILLQLMWGSIMWASLVTWCPSSVNFLHFDLLKNHWAKMDQTQMWLLEWSSSKIESGDLAWHLKWPWPLCLLVESLDTCRILVSVLARIWK
jgi:hypothetical protein